MKRYCQILTFPDNAQAIEAYVEVHRRVWPEIKEGIRSVGILDMQIYLHGHTSFMIMDTVDDFDWGKGQCKVGHPAQTGGVGSIRCPVPRLRPDSTLNREMATDGTNLQAMSGQTRGMFRGEQTVVTM